MKSYNEIMKECENIDLFLKGKTILKIKWWADSNDLSPTLIFTDGSSIDVIGKALNYNLKKINKRYKLNYPALIKILPRAYRCG